MGEYLYTALNVHGQQYSKLITAGSLHDAANQLRSDEVNVIGLELADVGKRRYEPAGQRPEPAPRDIEIRFRDSALTVVLLAVGGLFAAVASIFILVGLGLLGSGEGDGLFFVLFPMIHLVIGVSLIVWAVRGRNQRRRIYRDGEVAMATIEGTGYNRKIRVNNRNPYELVWSFEVDGHRYHDRRSTFDEAATQFLVGDRLWVLYDPADPEQSAEWPRLD